MSPLITVVIPVYNREKLLSRCVESVLAQEYKNFEIIIIDDGSSDSSFSVARDYADRYEKIQVLTQQNSGVSVARNKGIELSKGDYIIFVDSDDTIDAKMLSTYVSELETADYDLVVCGFANEYSNGSFGKPQIPLASITELKQFWFSFYSLLGRHILRSPCNKLYKTSIIKNFSIKFNPSFQIAEDALFNTEYYKYLEKVSVLKDPLYVALSHGDEGRLSQKYHSNFLDIQTILFSEYLDLLQHNNAFEGKNRKYLAYEFANNLWYGIEREYHKNHIIILPTDLSDELLNLLNICGHVNLCYYLFAIAIKSKKNRILRILLSFPLSLRKVGNILFRLIHKLFYNI